MAEAQTKFDTTSLPDWWAREKRQRQVRTLIFLCVILTLIAYFYYESMLGRIGLRPGITFNSENYITFVRQDKEGQSSLYAIRADGTDLRRLTAPEDTSDKFSPIWTMDGKSIVYVSNLNDIKTRQLYILGDGQPKQLTYGTGNKDAPVASPDGSRIAFVTQGAVKTVRLNGEDVYQEIPRPRASSGDTAGDAQGGDVELKGPFLSASFAPDGQGIAAVQVLSSENVLGNLPFGDQIARVAPPGSSRALVLDTGREVSVAWEPNGKRLACAFTELEQSDGKNEILVHGIRVWSFDNPTKPVAKPLFSCIGFSVEPKNIVWSPDGKQVAFEAWQLKKAGERELLGIVVMNVTDRGALFTPEDLPNLPLMVKATPEGRPQRPLWSPDGSRILYEMSRPNGGTDLWIINSGGINPIKLTDGKGNNIQGSWSPLTNTKR